MREPRKPKVEFYQQKATGLLGHGFPSARPWRWRLKGANGLIIADSAEAYFSESNVKRAFKTVRKAIAGLD